MPFWSSDKIEHQHGIHSLIEPFDVRSISQGAYELKLGNQAAITCDGQNIRKDLASKETFCIPPGQFGLMLTEEIVTLPANVLGLISLKTGVKSRGLVNVSGFHVDPGFNGRLKFWVYNAGSQNITILQGDPTFLIWFADLDRKTRDPYPKEKCGGSHNEITALDLQQMQGHLASPSALAKKIEELEHKIDRQEYIATTLIVIVTGFAFALAAPLFEHLLKYLSD